jgi:hypothetical protein
MIWTHLFSFAAVIVKWQFSNLKAPVIARSFVAILLVLEGSMVKSTKVQSLLFNVERLSCYFWFWHLSSVHMGDTCYTQWQRLNIGQFRYFAFLEAFFKYNGITKIVIKVNKNDIDLCNYNLPERDEFVTKVI